MLCCLFIFLFSDFKASYGWRPHNHVLVDVVIMKYWIWQHSKFKGYKLFLFIMRKEDILLLHISMIVSIKYGKYIMYFFLQFSIIQFKLKLHLVEQTLFNKKKLRFLFEYFNTSKTKTYLISLIIDWFKWIYQKISEMYNDIHSGNYIYIYICKQSYIACMKHNHI